MPLLNRPLWLRCLYHHRQEEKALSRPSAPVPLKEARKCLLCCLPKTLLFLRKKREKRSVLPLFSTRHTATNVGMPSRARLLELHLIALIRIAVIMIAPPSQAMSLSTQFSFATAIKSAKPSRNPFAIDSLETSLSSTRQTMFNPVYAVHQKINLLKARLFCAVRLPWPIFFVSTAIQPRPTKLVIFYVPYLFAILQWSLFCFLQQCPPPSTSRVVKLLEFQIIY